MKEYEIKGRRTTLCKANYENSSGLWIFFSVWMEVFKDEPVVKRTLIEIFPGTETRFFDADGNVRPILHVEELEAATETAT